MACRIASHHPSLGARASFDVEFGVVTKAARSSTNCQSSPLHPPCSALRIVFVCLLLQYIRVGRRLLVRGKLTTTRPSLILSRHSLQPPATLPVPDYASIARPAFSCNSLALSPSTCLSTPPSRTPGSNSSSSSSNCHWTESQSADGSHSYEQVERVPYRTTPYRTIPTLYCTTSQIHYHPDDA